MAIGIVFQGPGVTRAQYEQVLQQVAPNNQPPPGMQYHAAGATEDGWCVVEIWDSQEGAQRFFDEKLGQALQAANINIKPTFFQIVNTMQS